MEILTKVPILGKTATDVTSEKVECRTKKLVEQICSLQSEKATVTAGMMTLQANLDTRKGHQEKEVKELKVSAEKILKERDDLEEKISEMETMKVITDNRATELCRIRLISKFPGMWRIIDAQRWKYNEMWCVNEFP